MRVLVIDDEPDIRLVCRTSLSLEGHEVLEASDGRQGIASASLERPDVIVLDVILPSEDGISVLGALREHDETCDIPVILLSVKAAAEDQVRGLAAGADEYLPKPFAPAVLCGTVSRIAAMTPAAREEARARALERLKKSARGPTP